MAVLVAPWIGLLLGLVFAWTARDDLAKSERGPLASPAVLLAITFGLLILGPATGYFLVYARDWSLAYLIDSQHLSPSIEMLALLGTAGSPVLGYVLSARSASRRAGGPLLRWAILLLTIIAAVLVAFGHRFSTEASYAQFHGSFGTRSIAGGQLGLSLLWTNLVIVLSVAWVLHQLKRLGRATRN